MIPPPKQMPKLPDFPRSMPEGHLLPSSLRFGQDSPLLDRPSPILDPLAIHRKLLSQKVPGGSGGLGAAPAHSLYEMAALTHEMDTQAVTTKVKEILLANNVGQKLFGEHVLGLSQGSVSELLSKPKPWHMLSIKGREPFIRMQLWLNDPSSIEKLQLLKNERRESGKRKRAGGHGGGSGIGDSSSDRSSPADPSDMYAGSGGCDSPGSSSAKKPRVYFTDEQKEALKIAFALDPYPSTASMDFLSQELGLETRSISNWFHNHRMRLKQQLPHGMGENLALLSSSRDGQGSFDPVKFRLLLHQRMLELQSPEEAAANSSSVTSLLRQFSSMQQQQSPVGSHSSSLADHVAATGTGLDLTFKREDEDKDSIADSRSDNDDYNMGTGKTDDDDNSRGEALAAAPPPASSSRSRRKPAAPQWVRPDWMEEQAGGKADSGTAGSKDGLTINGVCVMNSYAGSFAGTKSPSSAAEPEGSTVDNASQEKQEEEGISS